jgi:heparosan-N-sulfate-glucuronate 5-epimerase
MARRVYSFDLPLGSHLRAGETRGYPIDFRVKSQSPRWRPGPRANPSKLPHVAIAQRGLGCYERYLAGEGDDWRDAALGIAEWLIDHQQTGGRLDGAWFHNYTFPHTLPVRAPWVSAMAQGEGASLLVRMHRETDDDRFADAALRAVLPMEIPSRDGGARAELDGGTFLEEYPTDPPSCVLNGGIFAIWGCFDVAQELGDERARRLLEASVDTLVANLDRYDIGYWSRYDLFPYPVINVASPAYHRLHIEQLKAMSLLTGRPEFNLAVSRFEGYLERRANRARALLGKGLFRVLIPTNRVLAGRFPWDRAIREPASKPPSEASDPAAGR